MKLKILFLFSIAFSLFFLAQGIRVFNGDLNIIGYPTYGLARVSEIFMSGTNYDPLAYQGHYVVYFPLYFYVLGVFSVATTLDTYTISAFLGPFMGAISALFFYGILKQLNIKNRISSSLVFILTPISVYMFSHAGSRAPPFMLSLMAFYFFIKNRKEYVYPLFIAALTHPIVASFFLLFILLYSYSNRKIRADLPLLILVIFLFSIPYLVQLAFIGPPNLNVLHTEYGSESRSTLHASTVFDIISFLPIDPFSAISLPIAVLAIFSLYKTKDRYILSIIAVTLISALAFQRFRVYMIFPFSLACARAFEIINKKWVVAFLVSMLPFAFTTSLWMSSLGPSQCFISLMPDTGDSSETVMSNWQIGHWVESFANKKVFMDGTAEYVPDVNRRYEDLTTVFTSEDELLVKQKISENNIDYILLLESDNSYFESRGLQVNIDEYGFNILKQDWCGTLYKT